MKINLPDWFGEYKFATYKTQQEKMALAIDLARQNVANKTGGPFGAAIFLGDQLLACGVNLVVREKLIILHAEIVAIIEASQNKNQNLAGCELITSVAPCAMCLGACGWANFARIICGARDEDARAIGFDEGEKPDNWQVKFRLKGVEIIEDVLRDKSIEVLQNYKNNGGEIY